MPKGFRGPADKASLANNEKFLEAHLAANKKLAEPVARGAVSARFGSVAWLVIEYFSSLDHLDRPASTREKHRRYIEDFRAKYGDILVAAFDQEAIEKSFGKIVDQPARANQWLRAIRDLFKYAIKRKLRTDNPTLDIKRRKPKARVGADGAFEQGHLTWPRRWKGLVARFNEFERI